MTHTSPIQAARGRKSRGGGRPRVSEEKIKEIIFLRKMNKSIREIADLLNLSVGCVFKHIEGI